MAAVAAIASVALAGANYIRQRKEARRQERYQKEASEIQVATQRNADRRDRSRAAREERVKRARILAISQAGAGAGSSGEIGANSALRANFGNAVAGQSEGAVSATAISAANQRIASSQTSARSFQAFTNLALSGTDVFDRVQSAGTG